MFILPKSKTLISLSVSALFMVSVFAGLTVGDTGEVPTEPATDGERSVAKWNVIVYLMADNDLDPYTAEDFQEFKDGGSSAEVNVLLLVDRLEDDAYLYCIDEVDDEYDMVMLEEMGEINMGDPKYLTDLMEFADTEYEALHTVLFFWDHGTPTAGVGVDTTLAEGDEFGSGWDWLDHREMVAALDGYHVDVIGTDECSIGQMETIYEYSALGLDVDYVVASESYIGWRGFSYDKIIQRLVQNPDMDGRDLSLIIVEEFTNLFSKPPYQSEILTTQSVFDMSEIPALGEAVTEMADAMAADIDSYKDIIYASQMASMMPWGARCEGWIDMPTFVESVMDSLKKGDPVYKLCEEIMIAYGEAMIGMGVAKNSEMYGYQGMGIMFPASYTAYTVAYEESEWGGWNIYKTFVFPNMGWWQFLETYWGIV